MLEELLKHNKLGNKEELLFFLFDGIISSQLQPLDDLQKYCSSYIFSGASSFFGLVKLCQFISFIKVTNRKIELNMNCFNPEDFRQDSYLDKFHIFGHLLRSLEKEQAIPQIFNERSLKFSSENNGYYVLNNKFPYKFFPIRNFLIATGFFEKGESLADYLVIKKGFARQFKEHVVDRMFFEKKPVKKISLEQLKKNLRNKEKVGKFAELKALEFERKRLSGHPCIEKIGMISEEFVNAGYDIESFNDCDSIMINRFIEVKSYDKELSFYWSKNELEKAKELGENYFIYFFDRSKDNDGNYRPIKVQNPYKRIFESGFWERKAETWKLTFGDSPIKKGQISD